MAEAGLGSLLQFIPSFLSLMHGLNNSGQKRTADQLAQVNNAIVNPNNPLYQQMYGQYRQQGQQQLGESISQMEGQNRMLAGMGRVPLFSPERQGETAFRTQAMSGPQIGIQAGQQTQEALKNALQGLYGAGRQGGVNSTLLASQYSPQRLGYGASGQMPVGLGLLANQLNSGQTQQMPQQQYGQSTPPQWPPLTGGLNAPGAQQGNSILSWLGGQ